MNKPSVTQLTGLLDKPALLGWANKLGLQGIELKSYRNKKMGEGTSLHKQIEDCLKNGVPLKDQENQDKFNNFFKDKKILASEQNIETDFFVGRFDIVFESNGKTFMADFKLNQSSVYFENKLQLIAYRMSYKTDYIAIIGIPEFNLITIPIENYKPYEQIMINLSNIYNLKTITDEHFFKSNH